MAILRLCLPFQGLRFRAQRRGLLHLIREAHRRWVAEQQRVAKKMLISCDLTNRNSDLTSENGEAMDQQCLQISKVRIGIASTIIYTQMNIAVRHVCRLSKGINPSQEKCRWFFSRWSPRIWLSTWWSPRSPYFSHHFGSEIHQTESPVKSQDQ